MTDTSQSNEALARHRIPVIERMMDMLSLLEQQPDGATIRDLVDRLAQPRSTVYRILNTLQLHGMVHRSEDGSYRLGSRLLKLASRARRDDRFPDLVAVSQPHLQRLVSATGEGCKISVIDGGEVLVITAVEGRRDYALTVFPGQRLPIHAGAAGKLLLAFLPKEEQDERLQRTLARFTAKTLTGVRQLRTELARIRRQWWSQDKGEFSPSVHAVAAGIRDGSGNLIAALSVPFLAGARTAHVEKIRATAIATAEAISADLWSGRSKTARANRGHSR